MSSALRLSRRTLAAAAASLCLTGLALAQETAPAPAPTPAPTPEPPKIDVGGYVDTYYEYNFNKVDPLLRTYDVQHNTFSLSAAEVNFAKVPTADSRVGFRADLCFGKAADLTAAFEPAEDGKEIYKHLQQAYVSLLTGKVQWDVGQVRDARSGRRSSSPRTTGTTPARSCSGTRSRSTTSACAPPCR